MENFAARAADLFAWGLIPCQPTPQKVARLREVLGIIKSYDVDALICGHGPSLDMSCILRFETYFDEMLRKVPPLVEQGVAREEIEKQVPPPADIENWWRFFAWKHAKNIELIAEHFKAS